MEKITSMHNPRVQAWRSLKTKSGREAEGAFLVEGFKSVGEALSSSFELLALIVEDGTALPSGAPEGRTFVVPAHLMAAVCDTKTPQGIAAVMRLQPRTVTGKRLLALDGVQDPGNVGTILRTADAAGLDGILYSSQCADPYSPKVLRASMGSVFHLPVGQGIHHNARGDSGIQGLGCAMHGQADEMGGGGCDLRRNPVALIPDDQAPGVGQGFENREERIAVQARGEDRHVQGFQARGQVRDFLDRQMEN